MYWKTEAAEDLVNFLIHMIMEYGRYTKTSRAIKIADYFVAFEVMEASSYIGFYQSDFFSNFMKRHPLGDDSSVCCVERYQFGGEDAYPAFEFGIFWDVSADPFWRGPLNRIAAFWLSGPKTVAEIRALEAEIQAIAAAHPEPYWDAPPMIAAHTGSEAGLGERDRIARRLQLAQDWMRLECLKLWRRLRAAPDDLAPFDGAPQTPERFCMIAFHLGYSFAVADLMARSTRVTVYGRDGQVLEDVGDQVVAELEEVFRTAYADAPAERRPHAAHFELMDRWIAIDGFTSIATADRPFWLAGEA